MIDITKSKMNEFGYGEWASYFALNDTQRLVLNFLQEKELTAQERKLIFPSVRAFSKGEGSDGAYLMKTVESFIRESGEKDYLGAMQLFVKEENFHSAYLREYMEHYGVEPLSSSFLDSVFRRLRKAGGLKCEVTILVTAEMIALTYYDALSKCTDSPVLKKICAQMLHDELPHIMFQSYTLSHFEVRKIDKLLRAFAMRITTLFVYCAFRNVFKTGGYNLRKFSKENMGYLKQSIYLSERNS